MNLDWLKEKSPFWAVEQLEARLLASGWRQDGFVRDIATIWHPVSDVVTDAEVLLPKPHAKDFNPRLSDALIAVAEFEKTSVADLIRSLSIASAEMISVRVIHEDTGHGSIPLLDGVLLNQRAKDLMVAAVQSSHSRRRFFAGRRAPEVTEIVSQLRLGQTEHGSYIVNVLAPTSPRGLGGDAIETLSVGQVVTKTLTRSLASLEDAISSYSDSGLLAAFDSTVEVGVSANLCDALIGFSGADKKRRFTITITTLDLERRIDVRSFEFDQSKVEHIETAAKYFRDNYVLPDETIVGTVKALDRVVGEEVGLVTVTARLSTGVEKNVKFELFGGDYTDAIHAHDRKELVECTGEVQVAPKSARLLNPRRFKVIRSEDLF